MEIFYYRDPHLNFGDDLNAVLWPEILPPDLDAIDDAVIVGIGSILTEQWLGKYRGQGKRMIVLGSGTSYDLPPRDVAEWTVCAVRGPLTAAMIGMPDKAVTDGAILLADAPRLIGAPQPRTDIVFMPHHRSIRRTNWKRIAEAAGMRYVTPQQPVADVLAAFARAKLIVTEAMHGAIVADTLRIPWVPVVIAPTVDEFKWRDWCLSMELPFEPAYVPAGDADDARRYALMERVLAQVGVAGHAALAGMPRRAELNDYLERRFSPAIKDAILNVVPRSLANKVRSQVVRIANPRHRDRAVRALSAAPAGASFLSDDAVFAQRLDRMRGAVRDAVRAARGA
jgi:hypothetical protein